jgi:hypothetical protein
MDVTAFNNSGKLLIRISDKFAGKLVRRRITRTAIIFMVGFYCNSHGGRRLDESGSEVVFVRGYRLKTLFITSYIDIAKATYA